ncbi:16S rRNA (uracil(1498)-N(3))-methyltransferase [Candidatus Hepatincolaceae symbiont of Richtersius coronifer]
MPAIYKIKSRFYFDFAFSDYIDPNKKTGSQETTPKEIEISGEIFHHLAIVLRAKTEEYISLFNEKHGEFLCRIVKITKSNLVLHILKKLNSYQKPLFNLHLAYAPLKKEANDFVLEKSTELGINEITPIITNYTVNNTQPVEKLQQKVKSAVQQCGRLDLPLIHPAKSLEIFLTYLINLADNQNTEYLPHIFWLNEKKNGIDFYQFLRQKLLVQTKIKDAIFIVGPEGGFSYKEQEILSSLKIISSVYLQGNILKSETACLAAIINYQALTCIL